MPSNKVLKAKQQVVVELAEKMNRATVTVMIASFLVMSGVISQKRAIECIDFNTISCAGRLSPTTVPYTAIPLVAVHWAEEPFCIKDFTDELFATACDIVAWLNNR